MRNVQLSLFSAVPGLLIGVYINNREAVWENGFFYGYTFWTWMAIFLQAMGGLIVAYVVKYADNILKGFATSISIIMTSVFSLLFMNMQMNHLFIAGSVAVMYGNYFLI